MDEEGKFSHYKPPCQFVLSSDKGQNIEEQAFHLVKQPRIVGNRASISNIPCPLPRIPAPSYVDQLLSSFYLELKPIGP